MSKLACHIALCGAVSGLALILSGCAQAQNVASQCIVNVAAQGTSDAITSAALPCNTTTSLVLLTVAATNTTTAPTYAPTGSPALPIQTAAGGLIAAGALQAGAVVMLSSTGSAWLLLTGGAQISGSNLTPGAAAINGAIPHVSNLAALQSYATSYGNRVHRDGYASAGDGGGMDYTFSASSCAVLGFANDGGYCINASGGGAWVADISAGAPVSVAVWGAGATDWGPVINAAASALCATGAKGPQLQLPQGTLRISGGVSVTWNCAIWLKGTGYSAYPGGGGTVFHITGSGTTALTGSTTSGSNVLTNVSPVPSVGQYINGPGLPYNVQVLSVAGPSVTINMKATATASGVSLTAGNALFNLTSPFAQGSIYSDFAFYQDQPAPGGGWTPTIYPPVFSALNVQGEVKYDNLMGYLAFDFFHSDNSGRLTLGKIYGEPINSAIWLDRAYDKSTAVSGPLHFWNYGGNSSALTWSQANGNLVQLYRADGVHISSLFALGYKSAVYLGTSASVTGGVTKNARIDQLYADSVLHGIECNSAYSNTVGFFHTLSVGDFEDSGANYAGSAILAGSRALYVAPGCGGWFDFDKFYAGNTEQPVEFANTSLNVQANFGKVHTEENLSGNTAYFETAATAYLNTVSFANPPSVGSARFPTNLVGYTNFYMPQTSPGVGPVTNGFTVNLSTYSKGLVLTSAGALTSGTINLPAYPFDGNPACVSSASFAMSGLSVGAGSNAVGGPAVTSLAAGQTVCWVFVQGAGLNTWFRQQ